MTAVFILRLTVQTNVDSRFAFFEDADSNLRTTLRGLDEHFFVLDLARYISHNRRTSSSLFPASAGWQTVLMSHPASRPQIRPPFPLNTHGHSSPRPVACTPAKTLQTLLSFRLLLFLGGTPKVGVTQMHCSLRK